VPPLLLIALGTLAATAGFATVMFAFTGHIWQPILASVVSIAGGLALQAGFRGNKRDRAQENASSKRGASEPGRRRLPSHRVARPSGASASASHQRVQVQCGPPLAPRLALASLHVSTSVALVALVAVGCGVRAGCGCGGQHRRDELVQHLDVLRAHRRWLRSGRDKLRDRGVAGQLPAVGSGGAHLARRRRGRHGKRVASPNQRRGRRASRTAPDTRPIVETSLAAAYPDAAGNDGATGSSHG
jgi:hypothetical protein